jgi:hypothetical protein
MRVRDFGIFVYLEMEVIKIRVITFMGFIFKNIVFVFELEVCQFFAGFHRLKLHSGVFKLSTQCFAEVPFAINRIHKTPNFALLRETCLRFLTL